MNDKNLTLLFISLFNICLITTIIPQIPITAQINQASELSKDDNVTSTIKPQGTSIDKS